MKQLINFWAKMMIVIIGVIIAMTVLVSCKNQPAKFQAPLFNDLGDYWIDATTSSDDANRFFVQGMLLTYNFNHGEAARSFREAIRLDSSFTMAYWGLAYTLGPNYNAPMEESVREEVFWSVEKASQINKNLKPWEKLLVEAMKAKYVESEPDPQLEDLANVLRASVRKVPNDANLHTFLAEALMLQHPWDLYDYKGGPEKDWTPEILEALGKALELEPNHPLANHLMIHATEASGTPEDGLEASGRLTDLAPGAGHLVHMPSHTYINTGDYHLGTEVNISAVKADSAYAAQCKAQGAFPLYYYHNYHFLAACAALEGRGALAIDASLRMVETIDKSLLSVPGFETTQHFMTIPYNVLVKFEQWEKILALKAPDERYPYLTGMWSFARGMAFINLNQEEAAKSELNKLMAIQETGELEKITVFGINSVQEVADIAVNVLSAEIARKQGDFEKAEALLIDAVEIEDALSYNEPPDWFFSVRHLLGDLYLELKMFAKAEMIYRKDLTIFPKNGFALNGLYHSLINQNEQKESEKVRLQFEKSWEFADSDLKYSRIDKAKRKDLVLDIRYDSPNEVIYLASNFCGITL